MTIMFVLRKIARAKATSWRSPALRDPPWLIGISRVKLPFPELRFNRLMRWHLSRTSQHSRSVCSPNGSKLLRIVPENKETSWLTIVCRETQNKYPGKFVVNIPTIRFLRSSRPMVEMSIPSILMLNQFSIHNFFWSATHTILPPLGSTIRSKERASVDLPTQTR